MVDPFDAKKNQFQFHFDIENWKLNSFFDFQFKIKLKIEIFAIFDFNFNGKSHDPFGARIHGRPWINRPNNFQFKFWPKNWILTQFSIQFNFQFQIEFWKLNFKSIFNFQFLIKNLKISKTSYLEMSAQIADSDLVRSHRYWAPILIAFKGINSVHFLFLVSVTLPNDSKTLNET